MSTRAARGFWPMRDLPVVGWLVAAGMVALAHSVVPEPRWLLIHLVLLGAATHSILVWSRYFTDAVLHTAPDDGDRVGQERRLTLLNAGALLVVSGVSSGWWALTLVGGAAVLSAVAWHGATLLGLLRRALPARFGITVRYYLASAVLLCLGVTLGIVLARLDDSDPWHGRVMVAHAVINLLGWIGITAIGTLVSLWPTMLRTRIATGAERAARLGLPALVLGVAAAAAGPLLDVPVLLTGGLALYLAGLALHAQGWVRAARSRPPVSFAPLSVGAALVWLVGCLVTLTVASAVTPSWGQLDRLLDELSPMLAIGFGAQLLVGALAYLVPVALGGGPTPVRVANAVLDRWASARLVATNVGLLLTLLPLPGYARLAAAGLVLAALLTFLAVLPVAARRSRSARRETEIARGGR